MLKVICDLEETNLLKSKVRDIPDFPKKGIIFKDLTPILKDKNTFKFVIDKFYSYFKNRDIDYIVGIESRGFILGAPLAYNLGIGFIPVRKQGKLPYKVETIKYSLEYGEATLEIHSDSIEKGKNVVIIDDLLATGGTVSATIELIQRLGGNISGIGFIVELSFLNGKERLSNWDTISLITY